MSLLDASALLVVILAGLYLLALGVASILVPVRASRFLRGFAGSAAAHVGELSLRVVVGAALVRHAPRTIFPDVFNAFGWLLLATSVGLLLLPWRWHRRFATPAVAGAIRHLLPFGLASSMLGACLLAAVVGGCGTG